MNTGRRTNHIIRTVRKVLFGVPEQRYFISGDRACRALMQGARRRQDPEAASILARAAFELRAEIRSGFWDPKPVWPVYSVQY